MGLYHRTVARHSLPGNKLGAVPMISMASVVYTNFQIHHTHTIILPPFAVNILMCNKLCTYDTLSC